MDNGLSEVKQFLHNNPEIGAKFHNYFEARREELIAIPWVQKKLGMNKEAAIVAAFIQTEILDDFGLKAVSRKFATD